VSAAARTVEVGFATIDSPLGELLLASGPRGLLRVAYCDHGAEAVLEEISLALSPRISEEPRAVERARRELEEYFEGSRRTFGLELDLAALAPFTRRVLAVTAEIPYGGVLSYGEVAAEAGSPRASRAVGNALGSNPIAVVIPCHRVLRSGGAIGGYGGGLHRKRMLLELEGSLPPASGRQRRSAARAPLYI
jgi:methylated-DNA-[protein]-cysteine S-methyltransferase